jgi:hypothetical protein
MKHDVLAYYRSTKHDVLMISGPQSMIQDSSQGILAYRAGTPAPPACMKLKKLKNLLFFMFYACFSLQDMQKCIF